LRRIERSDQLDVTTMPWSACVHEMNLFQRPCDRSRCERILFHTWFHRKMFNSC